jgi:HD-GYP domain-containing protein (c-di-GMP phosphodiesterase class II)
VIQLTTIYVFNAQDEIVVLTSFDMHPDRSITQKCDDLTQLLGAVCLPYCANLSTADALLTAAFPGHADSFLRTIALAKYDNNAAVSRSSNDCVFAIPIDSRESPKWFALGVLTNLEEPIANRLVSVASEAMWRHHEIHLHQQTILRADHELKQSLHERVWLRELNTKHAKRACPPKVNARQVIESARRFLNAEAIALFLYPDQDAKHGLSPFIASTKPYTNADIRYLLQLLPKPELGSHTQVCDVAIHVNKSMARYVDIVPLGETEKIGYVVSINAQTDESTLQSKIGILHDLADFLIADGYTNTILSDSEKLVLGTLHSMSIAIEARDPYTHGHSERVAQIAVKIAERLSLSETACQEIYLAGVLHDIGKIGIPDAVLLKPGKLSKEEFSVIQQHPEIGYRIIDELGKLKFTLPGILYHHERFDGNGYPHRLKGEEIPLMARILAVADAFDAMTSSRVYRNALDRTRAGDLLRDGRGTQWDANAVDACLDWLDHTSRHAENAPLDAPLISSNKRGMLSQALRTVRSH